MVIRILSTTLLFSAIAGSAMLGFATIPNQFNNEQKTRDLSQYEKAGPYDGGEFMENYSFTMQTLRGPTGGKLR